jgi:hypothetical protein
MAVSSTSPAATDEPIEPYVAPRTTRSSVKKVPQAQTRNLKRAKKAKETTVSLEPHASMVSFDNVSNSSFLAVYSYIPVSDALLSSVFGEKIHCLGH